MFSTLTRLLRPAKNPTTRRTANRVRLSLETLETREVMSATAVPGFHVDAGGNLYHDVAAASTLVDTNVQSILLSPDGTLFDVKRNGNANYLLPGGALTPLDTSVQSLAVSKGGTLYDLETNGLLYSRNWGVSGWKQIDTNVQSFVVSPDGSLFDVQRNGNANYVRNGGALTPLDTSVQSLAVGPDGTLYDLETNGTLLSRTWGSGWKQIDTNVQSFVVSPDGSLFDVQRNGNANYVRNGGALTPLGSNVQSLAVGPDGTLYVLGNGLMLSRTWDAGWKQVDTTVQAFALAPDGTLFEQERDGSVHTWTASAGLGNAKAGYALDAARDLCHWTGQSVSPLTVVAGSVSSFAVGADGTAYFLQVTPSGGRTLWHDGAGKEADYVSSWRWTRPAACTSSRSRRPAANTYGGRPGWSLLSSSRSP